MCVTHPQKTTYIHTNLLDVRNQMRAITRVENSFENARKKKNIGWAIPAPQALQ
jgi:hypothetical protein